MSKHQDSPSTQQDETPSVPGRRRFMNTAALAGLATVVACTDKGTPATPAAAASAASGAAATGAEHTIAGLHPKPGELDTYYGLWSGGHTGDMRVMGMPSGREIHRIPMFVPDALVGWGITNESKKVIRTLPAWASTGRPPLISLSLLLIFIVPSYCFFFFFFNDTATTEIYTLSLHDALPIYSRTIKRHVPSLPNFIRGN